MFAKVTKSFAFVNHFSFFATSNWTNNKIIYFHPMFILTDPLNKLKNQNFNYFMNITMFKIDLLRLSF